MQAMWISLKDNVNCGKKPTDVEKSVKKSKTEHSQWKENPMCQPMFRQENYNKHNRFSEVEIGDPSRNIIEMILRAASTDPSKPIKKTRKVLRVNNPIEIMERFEDYREAVKKESHEQYKRHPRSTVDGNELLMFYGTTMNCCSKTSCVVSKLCQDPTCRVCRLIQSGFNTYYNKMNGIRLSTKNGESSEHTSVCKKGAKVKRAVIVCRTIAGRVVNMIDHEKNEEEGYDSTKDLIVRNPSAVLPCFVVVFN